MSHGIEEILSTIPINRRSKSGMMEANACEIAEARHLGNLLACAVENNSPDLSWGIVFHSRSILPSIAWVVTKPYGLGENTSIVLSARRTELEGLIVEHGRPLRYLRNDATFPRKRDPLHNHEGEMISRDAEKLGFRGFSLGEPIAYLFPIIFEYLKIDVGSSFYSNIALFTEYMNQ